MLHTQRKEATLQPSINMTTIELTEKIIDKLSKTPQAKAKWETTKTARRIQEATELAVRGKLDEAKSEKIEEQLMKTAEAFDSAMAILATSTLATQHGIESAEIEFEAVIAANKRVLEKVLEKKNEKQSKQVEMLKFPERLKYNNQKPQEEIDFKKEREEIKIRIEKTKETLRQENLNDFQKEVIKDSQGNVEWAEKNLDDAEKNLNQGSEEKVRESLRESYRAAAEAEFIIEAISKVENFEKPEKQENKRRSDKIGTP